MDLSVFQVQGGYAPRYTLTVDGTEAEGMYALAEGTAEFTAFQLRNDKDEAVELPNGDCTKPPVATPAKTGAPGKAGGAKSAEPNFPVPEDAVWSYSFKVGDDANSFHITGVTLDAELVQFDGPESLRYLSGHGSARSAKAMPYHLASPAGSSFWIFCNLDRREQVCVWSEERIPLAGENKKVDFAMLKIIQLQPYVIHEEKAEEPEINKIMLLPWGSPSC